MAARSPRHNAAAPPRSNLGERLQLTKGEAVHEFYDVLLPDPDPSSLDIAQDLCEQYGLKLAQLGHAMAVEAIESKRQADTKGWAEDFPSGSTGQFIVSETRDPWLVEMRPPKRGERGWWVKIDRGKIVREDVLIGWKASDSPIGGLHYPYKDDAISSGYVAVTVVRNPKYMTVGWSAWASRVRRKTFRIEIWASYGGTSWDEQMGGVNAGVKGPVLAELMKAGESGVVAKARRALDLRDSLLALPAIVSVSGGSTLKIAEARAVELAWRVAKMLKIHAQAGSDAIDVITALRDSFSRAEPPPRAIVNPPGGTGPIVHASAEAARVRAIVDRRPARWPLAWDVFEVDREPWFEIQADDEANSMARDAGLPTVTDAEVRLLPAAQEDLRAHLEAFGEPEGNPRDNASGSWEVVSTDGGLEGIFAREEDAQFLVDELRGSGARGVKLQRRRAQIAERPAPMLATGNPSMTREEAFTEFRNLIRDPDPAAMLIAEDLALQHRWTLVALSELGHDYGTLQHRWTLVALSELGHDYGIYVLSPMYPADAPLYRIEWNIAPMYAGAPSPREFATGTRRSKPVFGIGFSFVWNNNRQVLQFASTNRYMKTREAAQRAAAADGWALAKRMKQLMIDEPQLSIEGVRVNLLAALRDPDATAPELYEHRSTRDTGEKVAKLRTYPEARDDIQAALRRAGWSLSSFGLKIPYATSPNGMLRLWFKPQAVWYTAVNTMSHLTSSQNAQHNIKWGHTVSYDLDIRKMTPTEFIDYIRDRFPQGFGSR